MNARGLVLLILAVGVVGCRPGISAPGDVNRPLVHTTLTGFVRDLEGRPLAGARVEMVDGRDAGRLAMTDDSGGFSLDGAFSDATQVRASHAGYTEAAASVVDWFAGSSPVPRSVDFALAPADTSQSDAVLKVGDQFTLTLAADAACTAIPPEFRSRSYELTIAGNPETHHGATWFRADASGPEFLAGHDYFPIAVTGSSIRFLLNEDGFPYMSERVTANAYLSFDGDAWAFGASRGSAIMVAAGGEANYCEVASAPIGFYELGNRQCPAPAVVSAQCNFAALKLVPR